MFCDLKKDDEDGEVVVGVPRWGKHPQSSGRNPGKKSRVGVAKHPATVSSHFFSTTFYPFCSCVSENRPLAGIFHRLEKGECAITGAHVKRSRTNHPDPQVHEQASQKEILLPRIDQHHRFMRLVLEILLARVWRPETDLVGLALVKLVLEYVAGHCWWLGIVGLPT